MRFDVFFPSPKSVTFFLQEIYLPPVFDLDG